MLPALGLHSLHLQIGGFLAQLRLGGVERHLKIEGIDDVEHVALVNVLVVDDPDFGDLPRYLRAPRSRPAPERCRPGSRAR